MRITGFIIFFNLKAQMQVDAVPLTSLLMHSFDCRPLMFIALFERRSSGLFDQFCIKDFVHTKAIKFSCYGLKPPEVRCHGRRHKRVLH